MTHADVNPLNVNPHFQRPEAFGLVSQPKPIKSFVLEQHVGQCPACGHTTTGNSVNGIVKITLK